MRKQTLTIAISVLLAVCVVLSLGASFGSGIKSIQEVTGTWAHDGTNEDTEAVTITTVSATTKAFFIISYSGLANSSPTAVRGEWTDTSTITLTAFSSGVGDIKYSIQVIELY